MVISGGSKPFLWVVLCLATLLAACTSAPKRTDKGPDNCRALYAALTEVTVAAGVVDVRHQRQSGFPYLRSSRFWASFDPEALSPEAYRAWLRHQNRLAIEGLLFEWQRLPSSERRGLESRFPEMARSPAARLDECGWRLIDAEVARTDRLVLTVHDHYQEWKRWLGLYPLTAIPFYRGVLEEHERFHRRQTEFMQRTSHPPSAWAFFPAPDTPLAPHRAARRLSRAPADALGIPIVSPDLRTDLLHAFAPDVAIARQGDSLAKHNHPGTVTPDSTGKPFVDPSQPTLYTHISHGRYRGQITVQLNYSLWFSERPSEGAFDILAGAWNGLTWRVHLLPGGGVIGFDKVHQCGCWYQFFPARGFRARPRLPITQEPPYIGTTLPPFQALTLWLEADTHHLLGITNEQPAQSGETPLRFAPYDNLRALGENPAATPFGQDGIIAESARLERFLFWPMGIDSPGAMRIHGTHAIAFIGERHWDDPWLLRELGVW